MPDRALSCRNVKASWHFSLVKVKISRTHDRNEGGGDEIHFQSKILPKYSRRTNSLEGLIPCPYLKGVSSGNFQEALSALFGANTLDLSADTILRLAVLDIFIS